MNMRKNKVVIKKSNSPIQRRVWKDMTLSHAMRQAPTPSELRAKSATQSSKGWVGFLESSLADCKLKLD